MDVETAFDPMPKMQYMNHLVLSYSNNEDAVSWSNKTNE